MMFSMGGSLAASIVAKATLIAALALTGSRMARRSRAALRHTLMAAAFGVLLLLPIASIVATILAPPVRIVVPGVRHEPAVRPFFMETSDATQPAARAPASAGARSPDPPLLEFPLSTLLLTGWFAGTAVSLLPVITGLRQVHRLRRTGLPWRHGQWIAEQLALQGGMRRYVEVVLHEAVPGPMTCGVANPAIVLPLDAKSWNAEDLNRAMVHELEHVRRADWVSHCLARMVCSAYWFRPLVWIAWRQLALEAERACDDAVLGRSEATAYADQLVGLARRLSAARKSSALAMANRAELKARVAAVLDSRQRRGRAGAPLVALAGGAAALVVFGMSPLRMVATPQETSAPSLHNVPKFEVASIKRCTQGFGSMSPDRIRTPCLFLSLLIEQAYVVWADARFHGRTYPVRLEGLPAWANTERYMIEAKTEGTPSAGMMYGPMLQSLLEDRFALKIYPETREGRVYALTVAKGGLILRPFQGGCTPYDWTKPPEPGRDKNGCRGGVQHSGSNVTFDDVITLDSFASHYLDVATGLDAPVINETGLTGYFHIHMEYESERKPGDPGYVPPTDDPPFPSIFTAMQQQLGLKLEATKGPHQVLVVDHLERPSAN
jgi:bla regulator protein BlaR1